MRPFRLWLVILSFCFAATLIAQSPSASTPQALTTLQSAFQALAGNTTVTDATLTGTAEWIAGSDDETGTVVLKTISGANRLDLSLSAGTRSEIRSSTDNGPVGTWIGPDGVSHPMANHNLMTDAGWLPCFHSRKPDLVIEHRTHLRRAGDQERSLRHPYQCLSAVSKSLRRFRVSDAASDESRYLL